MGRFGSAARSLQLRFAERAHLSTLAIAPSQLRNSSTLGRTADEQQRSLVRDREQRPTPQRVHRLCDPLGERHRFPPKRQALDVERANHVGLVPDQIADLVEQGVHAAG